MKRAASTTSWMLALVAVFWVAGGEGISRADPLDDISGTETWGSQAAATVDWRKQELRDWYVTRQRWRAMQKELKREARINRRLAQLLRLPAASVKNHLWKAAGMRWHVSTKGRVAPAASGGARVGPGGGRQLPAARSSPSGKAGNRGRELPLDVAPDGRSRRDGESTRDGEVPPDLR